MVVLHTNFGDIKLAMHQNEAPKTVENFLNYANSGFYNGTIFHRVIDGFMVQGGGFAPGMEQKEVGEPIENEANNGLSNKIGTVAMARTPDPHSATAQFFINVNNNSFNLNLFLNEKCKDAINISDFVDSIKLQLTDLEHFGYTGYVEGVSKILIKNLNELDVIKRPIHCSDLKREVLYIKDNNEWTKETDDKPVLKKAIKQVANKNIKQISEWAKIHPNYKDSKSKENDRYLKIVSESMCGITEEESNKNYSK